MTKRVGDQQQWEHTGAASPKRDKLDALTVALRSSADAEHLLRGRPRAVDRGVLFATYLRAVPADAWELMNLAFDDYLALYCVSRSMRRVVPLLMDWKRYARRHEPPHVEQRQVWAAWFAYNDRLPRTVDSDPRYRTFDALRRALVLKGVCFTAGGPKSVCGGCYRWVSLNLERRLIQYVPAQWLWARGYRVKRCFDCWHERCDALYPTTPDWLPVLAQHPLPMYCTWYYGMSDFDLKAFGEAERAWTDEAAARVRRMRNSDPASLEKPRRPHGLPMGAFCMQKGAVAYRADEKCDPSPTPDGYLFMTEDVEWYYRQLTRYVLMAKAGYPREKAERLADQMDLNAFRYAYDWKSLQEELKTHTALLVASKPAGPLHDDTNKQLAVFRQ